jgi:hypothetical protein
MKSAVTPVGGLTASIAQFQHDYDVAPQGVENDLLKTPYQGSTNRPKFPWKQVRIVRNRIQCRFNLSLQFYA